MKRLNTHHLTCFLWFVFVLLSITGCKKKEETQAQVNVPVVTTITATSISSSQATVGGNITSNGGGTIYQKGICFAINPNPTISDSTVYDHETTLTFTCNLSNLISNMQYYARAFALNAAGMSYGNQVTFTTLKIVGFPVLSTTFITNVTKDSAVSGGKITNDGGAEITAKGVCWSTSIYPTISDHHTIDGTDTAHFISRISGLSMSTNYYLRAYATNSLGTSYGNELSFVTADTSIVQPCPGLPSFAYEGKTYHTVLIGSLCWMKENLNVGTRVDGTQNQDPENPQKQKYCYGNSESYCDLYGGLYQWDEVMQGSTLPGVQGICPDGWHVPDDAEWLFMVNYLGGPDVAGGKMKSNAGWSDTGNSPDASGFSALPGGLRYYNGDLGFLGFNAYFWTSQMRDSSNAMYWSFDHANITVQHTYDQKILGYSVRCIKNQ